MKGRICSLFKFVSCYHDACSLVLVANTSGFMDVVFTSLNLDIAVLKDIMRHSLFLTSAREISTEDLGCLWI